MQSLSIDPRAYKFIRAQAMKTIADGLVEIITNCIDAYRKSDHSHYTINVSSHWDSSEHIQSLSVTDYALGMDSSRMQQCFLQVGGFTNEVGSRGFFSRGAKDICALGNVQFHSIKNKSYSKVILTNEAKGAVEISDIPITPSILSSLNLTSDINTTIVIIDIDNQYASITQHKFFSDLISHFALRDIFSTSHITVNYTLFENTQQKLSHPLQWIDPQGEQILDTEFIIDGYDNITASMRLFKTSKPLLRDIKQCGLLVRSTESIFCHSWLDMDIWADPMIEYVYGYIQCDYIKELMYQFDDNGANPSNPFLILDHSRGGLIDSHPFTKALFKYPILKLKETLADLDESGSCKRLTMDDLTELLDQFDAFKKEVKADVFAEPTTQKGWRDSRATQLFQDIQQMKNLVVKESQETTPIVTESRKKVSSFNLVFRQLDTRIRKRYEIKDSSNSIDLVINMNNPIFTTHFSNVNSISDIKSTEGLIILSEIFIDAFAKLLTDREIASNDHVKTLDPISILKYSESINQTYKVQLDQPIYKMFQKYLDKLPSHHTHQCFRLPRNHKNV
uniref:Histidine kinase/HSP90-like ATPase domain-containing protein n=1 Tax=viral metagenome TaxID=1070528 RepID=A0A6C0FDC3_9ZZZZ|tara:strand:- start:220 stop:1911 length:1692 start_codon:yes stop_codon:yes gene_type:complete